MPLKEFMPVDELKLQILSQYPFEVYDVLPIKFKDTDKQRAVYKVSCSDGFKCLKKVYFDESNLLFVYSVIQWFSINGIGVPKLLPTKSGGRYVKYNDNLFIVTDWVEGRKCNYDNEEDVAIAAENLGRMHRLSYCFKPIPGSFIRKEEINWYKSFNKKMLQLIEYYNKLTKSKKEFSRLFIENFDYYFERAKHAVKILSMLDMDELASPSEKYNTICHLDYVNKNLIITPEGSLYVIDFDKSKIDIPIHDIGTFLKRILKRKGTSWDFDILKLTLENYETQNQLTKTELLALYAFLEFPQKFWKVSRDYVSSKSNLNSKIQLPILTKTISQITDNYEFCFKFQNYLENRYDINLKF
ncbi:spore coat protein I [Oxobacter pfennigii]|uniref:Spore coat protein I n=1 Tax=Oxobacter pfennigii TaxID=36849 RepID=A0A0P8X011_9CLOT|nr:CotS family spore coat protein [Oxobacter pfennigii]KPU44091.1 spore coat protein I [Oxobacter pfennigii]